MMKPYWIFLLVLGVLAGCRTGGQTVGPRQDPGQFFVNFGKGVDALERNEFAAAIRFLKLALAEKPGSTKALNLRGVAYLMSGRAGEAEADFARVIELDPGYGPAYQNLGCSLVKENKLPEAEAILRRALERFPDSASAYFTLGSILLLQNRGEEAMAVMRRGLALDPAYFATERKFNAESDLLGGERPELLFSYARLFAAGGDVAMTADFLRQARKAGFKDWQRIKTLADFDSVRDDPALKEFLKL